MHPEWKRPVTGGGDEAQKVVQLFSRGERYSATTEDQAVPAQTHEDFACAAFGNARAGVEYGSLRLLELAGRCARSALGCMP